MTETHRRGFRALLDAGLDAGKIGRTTYRVERIADGTFEGSTSMRRKDDWGREYLDVTRYRFAYR